MGNIYDRNDPYYNSQPGWRWVDALGSWANYDPNATANAQTNAAEAARLEEERKFREGSADRNAQSGFGPSGDKWSPENEPTGYYITKGGMIKKYGTGDLTDFARAATHEEARLQGWKPGTAVGYQRPSPAGQTPEELAAAEAAARRQKLTADIQAFVDALQKTPGMDNPIMAGLTNAGIAAVGRTMSQTGLRGGLAQLAAADSAQRAALPWLSAREGLALQGMGLLNQRDIGLDQLEQGWAEIDMKRNAIASQNAMAEYGQEKNKNQAIGGVLGGVVGGIAGGIATVATAGAAAPLIPGLIAGGSALGSGIGGAATAPYTPPALPSARGGRQPSPFTGY